MSYIVAIDGPSGTGKGTVTKIIAKKLGLVNLDTGATYRCVALEALKNNIEYTNEAEIIKISENIDIQIDNTQEVDKVFLNGEDVTEQIRTPEVTKITSKIANIIEVRKNLIKLQRKLVEGKNIIAEGRDISSDVFPNADVKIYLDATAEVRAKRRYLQNQEKGINMSLEEVTQSIKARDKDDMSRPMGALKRVPKAIYIDTSDLTIDEVVEKLESIINKKR